VSGRAVLGTNDVVPGAPEPTASTPFPRTVLIPQWRVEEILRERLGELGVTVEYGSELAGPKQDGDGVNVSLQTASGSESDSFSYAIGCDGHPARYASCWRSGFWDRLTRRSGC
jgi:2-polyprenyl-6-methoxyphenol hydroxylase-like FAD-dependent oxidoreductase